MNSSSQVAPVLLDLPASWRRELQLQLTSEENVLAWLEVDLNDQLYFAHSLLVLTTDRLIWCVSGAQNTWHSLPLQAATRLELTDYAGVAHLRLLNAQQALLAGQSSAIPMAGTNTSIGVVATNATLNKAQAKRLAMSAHDGLARSIRPAHTTLDGDTLFAIATCAETAAPDMLLLTVMAAEATAQATVNAILFANGVHSLKGYLPSAMELNP